MSSSALAGDEIDRVMVLLGGKSTFGRIPHDAMGIHAAISTGFPGDALTRLVANVPVTLDAGILDKAVGVSLRTLQRRKNDAANSKLSAAQSARVWKFAEIVDKATAVLGSQAEAEKWLKTKAVGLEQQRPIDLLATPVGIQLVEQFLERLEYGVYA